MQALRSLVVAVVAFVVLAVPAVVLADGRVALVVGNSTYAHIGRLPNPDNDARDMSAALRRLGFEVTTEFDADRVELTEALRAFRRQSAGADVSLVFYAGHGIEMNGVNYLVPVDARLERDVDVRFETVTVDDLLVSTSGASLRLVILDACRNNPLARSMQRTAATRTVSSGSFADLNEDLLGDETLVAYAAAAGTTAADGRERNSPYTAALLSHLETPLEIGLLFRRVRAEVLASTNGAQRPHEYHSLVGEHYLTRTLATGTSVTVSVAAPATPAPADPPRADPLETDVADVSVGLPVTATDAGQDVLAYSLERPDESPFTVDPDSGQLRSRDGVTYDYETQPAHTVTLKAEDGHGGSATALVTVSLTDMGETVTADAGWDLTVAAGGTAWLDGTASSTDAGALTYSWALESWPGDSPPSLDNPASATPSFAAAVEGTYVVRLTASSGIATDTAEVRVTVRPSTEATALVAADLLVDTNRDGVVDSSDEAGEDAWSEASGAVFGPNADDDDEDGIRDGWDARVNGDADLLDMAPVVVRQIPGLHRNHSVLLEMAHAATSDGPQLFYEQADGGFTRLIAGSDRQAELPLRQLVAGDLRLHVDSPYGRNIGFDGQVSLTLTVRDGGATTSEDTVALQGGPILFSHHLQTAERVFVAEVPGYYSHHNEALLNALDTHLPAATELYRISYTSHSDDRWVQDFMQTGYSQNETETPAVHTRLHRGRGLHRFLPNDYLGPDAGYASPGGEYYSTFNYGGNVEVIPPHTHDGTTYPFGRIVIGGGSTPTYAAMAQRQIDFFNAQGIQGPAIVVDTSWLAVAHVDEIFSFLPNHNAASEERSWVIAIGSPALAVELLEEAVERGFGDAPIFAGRARDQTTANEMLADSHLMSVNDTAQAKIDTVRDELIAEVGLAEDDFREVPALFHEDNGLTALVPSMQNALVVDDVLFVADPEGPDVDGTDIWRKATLDALEGLGLTTHFIDVYYSYHSLQGAIHCATNVEREGSLDTWWESAGSEDSQ